MSKRLLAFVPLLIAAGCTVGKDYARPETRVEKSYAATTQPTTRPVPVEWWKTFNDPVLDDLVTRAVNNSLDLKLAAARLREARASRQVAGAGQYPQIDVGAGLTHTRLSKTAAPYNAFNAANFPWSFNTYNAGFDASWELDVFGGERRTVEAANAQLEAGEEGQRAVLMVVLGEVTRDYLELRGYQRAYEIAQANLKLQLETVELTQNRRLNGTGTELDVSRARAQAAVTRAALPQLQTLQWQALHRLALLLGEDIDPLAKSLAVHKPIPVTPEQVNVGMPGELLRRRPDIRRAERQVATASALVGVAQADLYPRFAINGNFGVQAEHADALFRRDSVGYGIGPSVSMPIFDGGRLRGIVKIRNAQQEQTVIVYEQTIRQAIAEVRDALVAFTQEHDRRRSLQEAEQANADSVQMARELYDKGLADFTTVLDAQRALYITQDALLRSELTESTSFVALYKALGGGWETQFPESPATQPVVSRK